MNSWSAAATFERDLSNITESYVGKSVARYACAMSAVGRFC